MRMRRGNLTFSFSKKLFSCINYVSNKISNWRLNDPLPMSWHRSLSILPWLVLWCILESRNGLFSTNLLAEHRYSWLTHNKPCFLIVNLHWFFHWSQDVYSFSIFLLNFISRNNSWWLFLTDVCGKHLKQ